MRPVTIEEARAWYPAGDAVHGFDHILRVLRLAEHIAQAEGADLDVVRAAVLLHDAQGSDGYLTSAAREGHHHASATFARHVLGEHGWPEGFIAAVEHCIRAHRYRDRSEEPRTLEAQVVFDADKLDALGAVGVARALAYAVQHGTPVVAEPSRRFLERGEREPGEPHSAYHEYLFKLRRLPERLHTATARALAADRLAFMELFFHRLMVEMGIGSPGRSCNRR